jgi:hypothetical protein
MTEVKRTVTLDGISEMGGVMFIIMTDMTLLGE